MFELAQHFVGRSSELAQLDKALDELDGGRPQAIEIVGAAGIGKTRLLAELAAHADVRGHIVLTGSGADLDRDLPFRVFVDALDEYLASVEPRRLANLEEDVRAELAHVFPSLSDLGRGAAAGLQNERYRTNRAVRELLGRLAATKPMVLILDDFHWADPASIDLMAALLHRPPTAAVLVVLAARPNQGPPRLLIAIERALRDQELAHIELDPLTSEEAALMLGREPADLPAAVLYEESGGNPFYLEQLARAGDQAAHRSPETDLSVADVQVPALVLTAMKQELTLLSAATRRILEGASVAGDPFEPELAAAASDLPEPQAMEAIDGLLAADLIRTTPVPRRFRFRHPIVRRAVYEAAPAGWRIGAHERVAQALADRGAGAGTRAHHIDISAKVGDKAAVASLTEAHEALIESLNLVPRDASAMQVRLVATCARVERLLGLHKKAHERLIDALEELLDVTGPTAVTLMLELAADEVYRLQYRAGQEWAERAVATAKAIGDPALTAAALATLARALAWGGQPERGEQVRVEAALMVDGLTDDQLATRLDAAVELASAEIYLDRFVEAGTHAERALAVGRATGQGQLFPGLYATLGVAWCMVGRLAEAADLLEAATEAARLSGNQAALAWALFCRAFVAVPAGDLKTAIATGQESSDLATEARQGVIAVRAASVLAVALLDSGKPEHAGAALAGSVGGQFDSIPDVWRAYLLELMTRCWLALDRSDEAQAAATGAQASAEAVGLRSAAAMAYRATAAVSLAAGDAATAADRALLAATLSDAVGTPIEAALARAIAGRALAQTGERDRALQQLEQAATELDRYGALRYRDAAERELRQLGQHIHRRTRPGESATGLGSLTEREIQIAQLIVDRKTNSEIASELFLSKKTIETHIRNMFRKLDADSRVDIARAIEQAERLVG